MLPRVALKPTEHSGTRRLSAELQAFAESIRQTDVSLGELMVQLEGRVYTFLLVILALPFCQPVSIPGFSVPFGIVIALLGLRFTLRRKPWLPKRLLAVRIPKKVFPVIFQATAKILRLLEKMLHPRCTWIFDWRATQVLAGLLIFCSALLLLLPLPIPFSNMFPALTIVLVASAFSERDGAVLLLGGLLFCATLAFFGILLLGGLEVVGWIQGHFHGLFDPVDEAPGILQNKP